MDLVRSEHRLYSLDGVGTLRQESRFFGRVTAEAAGRSWTFERTGVFRRRTTAADETGTVVGEFTPAPRLRRGGTIRWNGADHELRGARNVRAERFVLDDAATIDGRSSGKRPVSVELSGDVEPGLLLFAVFVVQGLTLDATVAAVAAVT